MTDEINLLKLKIGQNIRKYRMLCGYKQQPFSEKLGISTVSLSKIENGMTDIRISTLFCIAMALDVKLESLFHDPEELIHLSG